MEINFILARAWGLQHILNKYTFISMPGDTKPQLPLRLMGVRPVKPNNQEENLLHNLSDRPPFRGPIPRVSASTFAFLLVPS